MKFQIKSLKKKISDIIIHRSPFNLDNDEIKIQKIPKHIYKASYPVRILNLNKIINKLEKNGYKLIYQHTLDERIDKFDYKSYHFKKII